jgi:hypothetical protein
MPRWPRLPSFKNIRRILCVRLAFSPEATNMQYSIAIGPDAAKCEMPKGKIEIMTLSFFV